MGVDLAFAGDYTGNTSVNLVCRQSHVSNNSNDIGISSRLGSRAVYWVAAIAAARLILPVIPNPPFPLFNDCRQSYAVAWAGQKALGEL